MTRTEANQLLDEHKHGIRIYPFAAVTKALWFSGDLRGTSPADLIALAENGENSGVQGIYMAQGSGIGE